MQLNDKFNQEKKYLNHHLKAPFIHPLKEQ